jgi:hypothetical protein
LIGFYQLFLTAGSSILAKAEHKLILSGAQAHKKSKIHYVKAFMLRSASDEAFGRDAFRYQSYSYPRLPSGAAAQSLRDSIAMTFRIANPASCL